MRDVSSSLGYHEASLLSEEAICLESCTISSGLCSAQSWRVGPSRPRPLEAPTHACDRVSRCLHRDTGLLWVGW